MWTVCLWSSFIVFGSHRNAFFINSEKWSGGMSMLYSNSLNQCIGFRTAIFLLGVCIACRMWYLPPLSGSETNGDDTNLKQFVELPQLPEKNEKAVPSVLVNLETLNGKSDEWEIRLLDPANSFVLNQVDPKKVHWKIRRKAADKKLTIAHVGIRKKQLLFIWDKKNATDGIRRDLQQVKLRIIDSNDIEHVFALVPPSQEVVEAGHHGYDPSHKTPYEVVHKHTVPGLPDRGIFKLKVQCPYSENPLMKKSERQRTVSLRRWLKVSYSFEEDDLKRLKLALQWMAARPKRNKNDARQNANDILVHQKITYDLGSYKDLPLNVKQIETHINKLQASIKKDQFLGKNHKRILRGHQARAGAIAGARRGTAEWAEQTQVNNRINSTLRRIRHAEKRIIGSLRDIKDLVTFKDNRLESVLIQFKDIPYPYQVIHVQGSQEEPIIESGTWGITEHECFPLVGKWKNKEEGWEMEVTREKITTKFTEESDLLHHYFSRLDIVTPCVTEASKVQKYNETKEFIATAYFSQYGKSGARTLLRRQFKIIKNNPDIAHEKFVSYTKNWVAEKRIQYESPTGAVWTSELGEMKKEVEKRVFTWERMQ